MVIVVFLHMVRVVYTSAYFRPRRANWLLGMGLLIVVLLFNFSGYLLPWDQRSFWAVTVGTNMLEFFPLIGNPLQDLIRGGEEVNGATLLNFYSFHTGFLPIATIILMVYHFWKIRKARGLALADVPRNNETTDTIPNLVVRELAVALCLIAALLLFSLLFTAPLLEKANPAFSPNPAKAPWYFLGIQELMLHFHPVISVIFIPVFILLGFFMLPYLTKKTDRPGEWFHGRKGRNIVLLTLYFTVLFIILAILIGEYVVDFGLWMGATPMFISEGIIPFIIVLIPVFGWFILIRKRFRPGRTELILALFTFVVAGYLVLMFTGIWFRGPGMALMWPWQI
jgi:quinol-cytochrome oxidoreductase complex cytochrome b subunit